MDRKPQVQLTGRDGNAMAIMAACRRSGKDAGWDKERIDGVINEMMSGDYDNVLQTAMKHFDVM